MTDFPDFSEEKADEPNREATRPSKVRRVSLVRVKKSTPSGKIAEDASESRKEMDGIPQIIDSGEIGSSDSNSPDSVDSPASNADWQDTAPETVGGAGSSSSSESAKRKRKRRRGKGGGAIPEEAAPAQTQLPKARMNPEQLAKSAWKIYLAEVSEEGVALVGDHDARELARRCFRLAEIFLEEQEKRCGTLASKG